MLVTITEHIALDHERRIVRIDDREVQLTRLEYALLEYLATHPNKICSKSELIDYVWGNKFQYDQGTIDVHLNAIRRKTGWNRQRPIETLRGLGLVFRTEEKNIVYTFDLQSFVVRWVQRHTVEFESNSIVPKIHLTPFVNELSISSEVLEGLFDAVLVAFLQNARPGILNIYTKLTLQHFLLSLELNGTINEFRIPIYSDLSIS